MAGFIANFEEAGWGLFAATLPALSYTRKGRAMDVEDYNGEKEIWKDIPGWEGVYQASCLGRIRSVPRTKRHKARSGLWFDMPLKGRVLRPGRHEKGYLIVALSDLATGRKPRTFRVHRLVCAAFYGAPGEGNLEAAHNNGIRDDNRASNLRWATHKENMADVVIHRAAKAGL